MFSLYFNFEMLWCFSAPIYTYWHYNREGYFKDIASLVAAINNIIWLLLKQVKSYEFLFLIEYIIILKYKYNCQLFLTNFVIYFFKLFIMILKVCVKKTQVLKCNIKFNSWNEYLKLIIKYFMLCLYYGRRQCKDE